ncbi:MAG: type II secretion system GspH family protein [Acidobacteriota bacterium]|nr:type II secretion system GspH family protein [Acidobacteriota bacterium]
MGPRTTTGRAGERGFTLASLIVIMTLMMVIVAYTVPRQWSTIVQRDRELRTIQIMKEYAKAIDAFEAKNKALPVSVGQLKDARQPRFLRGKGEYPDPLTGEVDWLIITQAAGGGPTPVPVGSSNPIPSTGTAPPGIPMKAYAGGPFVGIRPGKTGNSLIEFMGSSKYEEWKYTVLDYRNDRGARLLSAAKMWQ